MYLSNLASILRGAGLTVVEQPGHGSRGHGQMSGVRGVMWHHTATSASARGDYPSLNLVTHGRSDLAGPLCNLGLGRNGTWYVIAAGLAWHAGSGHHPTIGSNGNGYLIGVEAEHPGTKGNLWPPAQIDSYRRGTAALLKAYGLGADRCIGHKEWTSRKIDPYGLDMAAERRHVAQYMTGGGGSAPQIPELLEDDMGAIPYEYQGTGRGGDGKLLERCHVFTIPVGSVSLVVERAWLSFKCGVGAAESVRLMAIAGGAKANYMVDKSWTKVPSDANRVYIEAPSGADQFTAFVRSEFPYSLGLETLPKRR